MTMSEDLEGWLIASIVGEVNEHLKKNVYSNQWGVGTREYNFYHWAYEVMEGKG